MSEFQFKRFTVINDKSAMKVNTDGVLLGAAMTISPEDSRILDIGTGTGTIALMAAQRLSDARNTAGRDNMPLSVIGIDIDKDSAEEAQTNFLRSPWAESMEALNCPLEEFECDECLDLIFSNPPYFENSLQNPLQRKSNARHTGTLSYREILHFCEGHLAPKGRLSLVLPADLEKDLCRYARMCGFRPFRVLRISTVARKAPSRIVIEFSRERVETVVENLVIHEGGSWSEAYRLLTEDFYIHLA